MKRIPQLTIHLVGAWGKVLHTVNYNETATDNGNIWNLLREVDAERGASYAPDSYEVRIKGRHCMDVDCADPRLR